MQSDGGAKILPTCLLFALLVGFLFVNRKEGSILTVEVPKTPVPLVYGLFFYLFNAYWVNLVFHPVVASPIYV
jgi:hypothetical protein